MTDQPKQPVIWVKLTGKLRLELLGVLGMIIQQFKSGQEEEAQGYLETLYMLLLKAQQGDHAWIEANFEDAMVALLNSELNAPDAIDRLRGASDAD